MKELVQVKDKEAFTNTLVIAEGTRISHEAVIKLVRRYKADLEELGPLGFKIRKGEPLPQGGFAKATEYALLNEHQATLVFTYMRNIHRVRRFKITLVKAFFQALTSIKQLEAELARKTAQTFIAPPPGNYPAMDPPVMVDTTYFGLACVNHATMMLALSMKSDPRAKLLMIGAGLAAGKSLENLTPDQRQNMELKRALLKAKPLYGNIHYFKLRGITNQDIAKLLDRNVATIRKTVRKMEELGLLAAPENLKTKQEEARSSFRLIEGGAR